RVLKKLIHSQNQFGLKLITHPELNRYLEGGDKDFYSRLAATANAELEYATNDQLHLNEFFFYSTLNGQRIDT
ncbi:MAG: ribonuclease E/G, partial [Chlamydiae bacterium]|nr:ribonuclease E/G [Chlamydiota bacterium]